MRKQKIAITLTRPVIDKLKTLARKRKTSVSALLKEQIEVLFKRDIAHDVDYDRAKRRALASLEKGFNLEGSIRRNRNALHERRFPNK